MFDSNQLIRNLEPKWPGSVHDARMVRNSSMWDFQERGNALGTILGTKYIRCCFVTNYQCWKLYVWFE